MEEPLLEEEPLALGSQLAEEDTDPGTEAAPSNASAAAVLLPPSSSCRCRKGSRGADGKHVVGAMATPRNWLERTPPPPTKLSVGELVSRNHTMPALAVGVEVAYRASVVAAKRMVAPATPLAEP